MKLLNSQGQPIELTSMEKHHSAWVNKQIKERFSNELGFEIDITTLTTIQKKITEQKFFELAPADYMPVRVGNGAWSSNLVTYREFSTAGDFETGLLNQGSQDDRLAGAEAAVDSIPVAVKNWAKQVGWNLMELNQAAKAGNWDIVTAKEKARKKNWDLGIQKIAFLGGKQSPDVKGLLTQVGVTVDAGVVIPTPIKLMTTAQLKVFTGLIIEKYRENCARSAWPTHFIIPESDYNGLASQASADFPIKSTLELLEEAFKLICRNPAFKILPCAYADVTYSEGKLLKNRYTLINYEEESLRMDIPVDYTATLANSLNNFTLQNVAYGQFTGVMAYRPKEMLYLDLP